MFTSLLSSVLLALLGPSCDDVLNLALAPRPQTVLAQAASTAVEVDDDFVVAGAPFAVRDAPRLVTGVPLVAKNVPRVVAGVPFVTQDVPRVVAGVPIVAQNVAPVVVGRAVDDESRRIVRRIGVTTRRVDDALAYHLGVDGDDVLLVAGTQDGMPAEESGLTTYDVIVSVDGAAPTSSDVLRRAVASRDEVVLVVRRGAATHELKVPVREVEVADLRTDGFFNVLLEDETDVEQRVLRGLDTKDRLLTKLRAVDPERHEIEVSKLLAEAAKGARLRHDDDDAQRFKEYAEKLAQVEKRFAEGFAVEADVSRELGLAKVFESARAAASARERAAREEIEAELAQKRAVVEARRAEVEALRGALGAWGEDEDRAKLDVARNDLEVELTKLRSAATDLANKQKLLELKAGEALIRDGGGRLELVLPPDRTKRRVVVEELEGGAGLDALHERLDDLTAITKQILEILTDRSAR